MQDYAVAFVYLAGGVGEAVERLNLRQLRTQLFQRSKQSFRGQIANQSVLREGTPTEAANSRIEAAATGLIGSANLGGSVLRAGVQMYADLQAIMHAEDTAHHAADERRRGKADGVRERDLQHTGVDQQIDGAHHFIDVPGFAVGVAEGHGDVGDQVEACLVGELANLLQLVDCLFGRLALVALQERRRDGVRKAERLHGGGFYRPFSPARVHHNANDFDILRRIEEFEYELGVSHLWHGLFADEADSINVLKARGDQIAQVLCLHLGVNDFGQPLPGIARALNDFDQIAQVASPTL